jgi:phenylpropionate dioxygenase-like ring-hydroxylating dioxygenase large terminal subunit
MEYDYRTGFVAYPDAEPGSPSAKAAFVDMGTSRIDPSRYWTKEEADLEWEHMWTKAWWFAGLAHDIPSVGDYFKVDHGRESFIVVRTGEGPDDIAAYYNVCPHRGNRIAHSDFGAVSDDGCFRCDFHGWRFGIDGSNMEIRDEIIFRPEVIAHRPGLKAARCGVWNSLIFISMAEDGPSLLEQLDVMPEHLKAYPFDKYRVLRDIRVCWDANWKTALDAFVEFYHADDVHPQVLPFSETLECQYDLYDHGLSRMVIPLGYVTSRFEDRVTVPEGLKMFLAFFGGNPDEFEGLAGKDYAQALAKVKRAWAARHGYSHFHDLTDVQVTDDWNYFVFPNITINAFSDAMLIQVFRPHPTDPEKSYYRAISMNLPVTGTQEMVMDAGSFGPEAVSEPGWDGEVRPPIETPKDIEDFGSVLSQDARRVPEVQKGLRSRAFSGYILSESEVRIRHYLAEIDRYIGRPTA